MATDFRAKTTARWSTDYTAFGASLPACFERAADLHPNKTAVHCRLGEITYADLNGAASRLAQHILATRGQVGDRVAILMPQDRRSFIAVLGALKAGRIVVVLNCQDPQARIAQIVKDADPTIILTVGDFLADASGFAGDGVTVIDAEAIEVVESGRDSVDTGPDDIAFLVYTSGSTGQPKGVMQTHGQLLRSALDVGQALGVTADDRVLLVASLWGGQATTATWLTFLHGASLLSFPVVENGLTGLADWMTRQRASIFVSASSLFRHFMKTVAPGTLFPDVRCVRLSADAATREDFEAVLAHFPNAELMHAMGMSEASHLACMSFARDAILCEGRLPVGRPADGVDLRIVDNDGCECPPGMIGTVWVRLPHLAAGYWRDPELTATCFFQDPDGVRGFRSGDLASIDDRGMLMLAGRKDAAHKIRGQRVDIAEVEGALATIAGVSEVAVVAVPRPSGEPYLVAYIVPVAGFAPSASSLRRAAQAFMPRHLIPSILVVGDALPRTANGKIDRTELRERAPALAQDAAGGLPQSETENLMARIWAEAFGLEGIGRLDDFFELGGDSLTGTVIAARMHEAKRLEFDFGAFVRHPILKDLAAFVDRIGAAPVDDPLPKHPNRRRPAPISIIQSYHWQKTPSSRHARGSCWRIEGPLDIELLRLSLNDVIARHEILRTRFDIPRQRFRRIRKAFRLNTVRGPHQYVQPPGEVALPLIDLSEATDVEARFEALVSEAQGARFDLSAGAPLSFTLVRLDRGRHALLVSSHHIISDGPSWTVFARDLAHFYEARLHGRAPSLPPLSVQYADYARWEVERWRPGSAQLEDGIEWWAREFEDVPAQPASGWLGAFKWQEAPSDIGPSDGTISWGLDAVTSERMERLGKTLTATYLAVRWAALLPVFAMIAGHDKVVIGTNRTFRTRVELEQMFGPLFGGLVLPLTCDWKSSFRDLVSYTQQKLVGVPANAGIPEFALFAEFKKRGIAVSPPVLRLRIPTLVAPVKFGDLTLTRISSQARVHSAITISFDQQHEQDGCLLEFNPRVYDPQRLRGFLDHLIAFIRNAAAEPTASVDSLIEADGLGAALRGARVHGSHSRL